MRTIHTIKFLAYIGFALVLLGLGAKESFGVPPLVAGDVPTAEKGHVELYVGTRYQKTGSIERQLPATEIVYGISSKQEVTFEIPYLSTSGQNGFGDAVLGTKYLFLSEIDKRPGIAGSFEVKLDNGSQAKGLGTGAVDYNLLMRAQKTCGWFTGIINLGYTFIGEPKVRDVRQERNNVFFSAFAQEYALNAKTWLLSEIYWETSEEPGTPDRLAADVGFKHYLLPNLTVYEAVGKSLREGNRGGPRLRVYAGMKLEF